MSSRERMALVLVGMISIFITLLFLITSMVHSVQTKLEQGLQDSFLTDEASAIPALPCPLHPTPWPVSFFASELRNGSTPEGKSTGFAQILKFYDAGRKSMKEECSMGGITSTFLVQGTDAWIYNTQNEACEYVQLPVGIISRDWFMNATFKGVKNVNSVLSTKWVLLGHEYYEAIGFPRRPTRVFTPLDQKGNKNTEDYGVFMPTEFDDDTFAVPDFCSNGNYSGVAVPLDSPEAGKEYVRKGNDGGGGSLRGGNVQSVQGSDEGGGDSGNVHVSTESELLQHVVDAIAQRGEGALILTVKGNDTIAADPMECFLPVF